MGKENEAEVRCVIYTSQIDEKLGKRVEQVPVGAAGGGGVITIGRFFFDFVSSCCYCYCYYDCLISFVIPSEPGSTFRLDSNKLGGNHSCRIIFGKVGGQNNNNKKNKNNNKNNNLISPRVPSKNNPHKKTGPCNCQSTKLQYFCSREYHP